MADSKIRGITVEIGGDTTKLGKAIEDSEKHSRSLQVELRQVEKLLKFDPTNIELLSQKQTILTQNIEETSKKLDTLKEAEKQVIAQFQRGEVAEEQVRALQREIIQTEKSLGNMRTELESTKKTMKDVSKGTSQVSKDTKEYEDAVENAKKELEDFKNTASETFDTLKNGSAVIGGAVVAVGGYSLKLSTDFDKAFNTLITKTGAETDELEELNTAMENVYANNFGESIEDVAESMATVRTNTKLSGEELQNITERAILLRDTFEFDVNESTRTAKMLMDQYGISAEEAYNLIAQGAQNGLNKNGDLLDTINEYAVHFKQLGIDAPSMFNMLVSGAESGTFSVDKLGDAIKEFGIRAKDGSDSSRKAFEYLGYDADKLFKTFNEGGEDASAMTQIILDELASMPDSVEKTTAGVALFGTMWEDLGADGIRALSKLDGGISTTKNALDEINNTKYDDLGSALQGLKRELETDVLIPLGEEIKPVVEEAIEYVKANAPEIKALLASVVSLVGDFVGFIVKNGSTILSIIAGIGTAFATWKVVGMISGLVSVITSFIGVVKTGTTVMSALNTVLGLNPIGIIITLIAGLVVAFIALWNNCEGFREFWINLWETIKNALGKAIEGIGKFFTETIPNFFKGLIDWIKENWQSILLFLINPFAGLFKYFYDNNEKFKEFVDTAVSFIKELPGKIWKWLLDTINKVNQWRNDMINKAKETALNFINGVITTITQLPSKIWSALQNAIGSVREWGSAMISTAGNAIREMVSNIINIVKELPSKFLSIGRDIINGIKNGITGAIGGLYDSIKSGLTGLVDKAKKALGINSPSKVFADVIGRQIPAGIAQGVTDNTGIADNAITDMTDDLTDHALELNGATINRKLSTTFTSGSVGNIGNNSALLSKLDSIYERLNRLQIVLDTGTLVGETIDKIDAGLASNQSLRARGV